MKEIILNNQPTDIIHIDNIDSKYIYAGLDSDGDIVIATKVSYNDEKYVMKMFIIGNSNNDGFTLGASYEYQITLKDVIKEFIEEHQNPVYEFKTIKNFLEWAMKVTK